MDNTDTESVTSAMNDGKQRNCRHIWEMYNTRKLEGEAVDQISKIDDILNKTFFISQIKQMMCQA